jgi:hypothetical protein
MATITRRVRASASRDFQLASGLAIVAALFALAGEHKFGLLGLLTPLGLVGAIALVRRPAALVMVTVGVVIVCEGPTFGLLNFTSHIYADVYRKLTPVDLLVALTVVAVGFDLISKKRPVRLPRLWAFALALLALGMFGGVMAGRGAGLGTRSLVLGENVLAYLLFLPVAVMNLDVDRNQIKRMLAGAAGLAIVKAILGLIEVIGHQGASIEGSSTLTYYEPTANWLIFIAILCVLAALLLRARPPTWILVGAPLLFASLLLSYRRSFWVAAILGIVLVLLLGGTAMRRRILLPASLLVIVAIWVLGSINLHGSQSPVVRRVASLSPSKLETNVEDRYRLDERTNVIDTLREHPVTGLGVLVPWSPVFTPLSVEHPEARLYVHFALLFFWLKLGLLGMCAYVTLLITGAFSAWRVWRRSPEPLFGAFGLASLCGFAGLVAIETTATFTGVDPRFTVLLSVQIGLLGLLTQTVDQPPAHFSSRGRAA